MSAKIKPIVYHLEVYEPGNEKEVMIAFSAAQPFQAVSVGDRIYPSLQGMPGEAFKVIRIEHLLWEGEERVSHKVMVFTVK
jgi:hypothetical protein